MVDFDALKGMDGFTTSLIVIGYRLLLPLTILRWPLGGYIAAMLADASDAMVFEVTGWGLFSGSIGYSHWDKGLDIWYLLFGLLAVRKYWTEPLARKTAHWLFGWRALGVATYFFWPHRVVFLLAPSIFENFYLLWTVIRKWRPSFAKASEGKPSKIAAVVLLAGIPKFIQEYLMHYQYVDQTWNFFRDHLFWWIYR
ncbi:MAG: hypothetical protein AAB375_02690 [Patescibacteria group bacterium]